MDVVAESSEAGGGVTERRRVALGTKDAGSVVAAPPDGVDPIE